MIATRYEQAQIVLRAARTLLEGSPLLGRFVESVTDTEIRLKTGAVIAAFPCSSRSGRGYPISMLLLDEVAHFVDTDGNASADEMVKALQPSLAQFGPRPG